MPIRSSKPDFVFFTGETDLILSEDCPVFQVQVYFYHMITYNVTWGVLQELYTKVEEEQDLQKRNKKSKPWIF